MKSLEPQQGDLATKGENQQAQEKEYQETQEEDQAAQEKEDQGAQEEAQVAQMQDQVKRSWNFFCLNMVVNLCGKFKFCSTN